MSQFFQATLYK